MSCPIGPDGPWVPEVRADHIHQLNGLPGSWSLILILCIFSMPNIVIGYAYGRTT